MIIDPAGPLVKLKELDNSLTKIVFSLSAILIAIFLHFFCALTGEEPRCPTLLDTRQSSLYVLRKLEYVTGQPAFLKGGRYYVVSLPFGLLLPISYVSGFILTGNNHAVPSWT